MACHLLGSKPLSKPMPGYCQLCTQEQTSVKFLSKIKSNIFIQENAFEKVVCEMAVILSSRSSVNTVYPMEYLLTCLCFAVLFLYYQFLWIHVIRWLLNLWLHHSVKWLWSAWNNQPVPIHFRAQTGTSTLGTRYDMKWQKIRYRITTC